MQKKIIALAIAAVASGAAFAQSNVTVYGVADLSFDNVSAGGAATSTNNLSNRNRVSANSSVLGFKGEESLGNGLKAVFQFESGISADVAGTTMFTRDSFVGIGGNFGTVVLGNLTGPTRALGAAMDPFAGATGITSNAGLIGKVGGGTGTSAADTRIQNAIAYVSPSFNGFTVTAGYMANENKSNDGLLAAGTGSNTSAYDLGLRYANGPIMAGLTQLGTRTGNLLGTKYTVTRGAAKFMAAGWSVGLLLDRAVDANKTVAGTTVSRNAWMIPVTFNVSGNGKLLAQYGKAADTSTGNGTGANMFALGYEHSLSKRTMIKAVWSQINNEAAANYDFGVNSVSAAPSLGADPRGLQIGLRHSF